MSNDFDETIKEYRKNTALNIDILENAPEDEFHDLIINYVCWREERPANAESLANIPSAIRYTYATYMADCDIFCGGLEQYFLNSGFVYVDDAILGYKFFGLESVSDVISKAKVAKADRNWVSAAKIEKEFYELNINFNKHRYSYFLKNKEDFVPEPDIYYGW